MRDLVPLDLTACPPCRGPLRRSAAGIECAACGRGFPVRDGVPVLLAPEATRHIPLHDYKRCYETYAEDERTVPLDVTEWSSVRYLARFIRASDADVILDVGAGCGRLLERLPGRRVALDISEVRLTEARHSVLEVVCGQAERLPFRDGVFDVLICSMVLEHVLDLSAARAEIRRVLRAGGRLYLQVPYREDITGYSRVAHIPGHEFTHLRSFDEDALERLTEGFDVLRRRFLLYPKGSRRRPILAAKTWARSRFPSAYEECRRRWRALHPRRDPADPAAIPSRQEYLEMAAARKHGWGRHLLNYVPRPILAPFLRPYSVVIEARRRDGGSMEQRSSARRRSARDRGSRLHAPGSTLQAPGSRVQAPGSGLAERSWPPIVGSPPKGAGGPQHPGPSP